MQWSGRRELFRMRCSSVHQASYCNDNILVAMQTARKRCWVIMLVVGNHLWVCWPFCNSMASRVRGQNQCYVLVSLNKSTDDVRSIYSTTAFSGSNRTSPSPRYFSTVGLGAKVDLRLCLISWTKRLFTPLKFEKEKELWSALCILGHTAHIEGASSILLI